MNVPALVSAWLREDEAVAERLGDRAYTVLPATGVKMPAARIARVAGGPITSKPVTAWEVLVQIEVWADRKAEVADLTDLIVQAVADMPGRTFQGATFSAVRFVSIMSAADTTTTPPRPRNIVRFYLTARPI